VDWLDLVSQYGYYDHSHLIKDFSFYLNMTPRQFLQQIAQGTVCSRKPGKFY
jgi:AraC-like DNA-binding protein